MARCTIIRQTPSCPRPQVNLHQPAESPLCIHLLQVTCTSYRGGTDAQPRLALLFRIPDGSCLCFPSNASLLLCCAPTPWVGFAPTSSWRHSPRPSDGRKWHPLTCFCGWFVHSFMGDGRKQRPQEYSPFLGGQGWMPDFSLHPRVRQ